MKPTVDEASGGEAAIAAAIAEAPLSAVEPVHEIGGARTSRQIADRVFWSCLLYTVAVTAVFLFFALTRRDGGILFRNTALGVETFAGVAMGFAVFWFFWGYLWYIVKWVLLRRFVGMSRDDAKGVFASRMGTPFDLPALLAKYSERRIRIADMITRRGRTVPSLMGGFVYLYFQISQSPGPESLAMGIQQNFLDALSFSFAMLVSYYSSGLLGRVFWGAHARVMDGVQARANGLLIGTMWTLFKFVMIPLGVRLALVFPVDTYAALFVFIWVSYLASDCMSEVVGALFGKQKLRVWGLGDVNRKSVAGTWACFLASLAVCAGVVIARGLPWPWLVMAVVISIANTVMELFSPRGTDDFTMATTNALLCWGFGAMLY